MKSLCFVDMDEDEWLKGYTEGLLDAAEGLGKISLAPRLLEAWFQAIGASPEGAAKLRDIYSKRKTQ